MSDTQAGNLTPAPDPIVEAGGGMPPRRYEVLAFRAWLVLLALLLLLFVVLATAAIVRHAVMKGARLSAGEADAVLAVAEFPGRIRAATMEVVGDVTGTSYALIFDRADAEMPSWKRIFPAPTDPGFLLLSGIDPVSRQSTVRLLRIADGTVIARWAPDWKTVIARTTPSPFALGITRQTIRAFHPMLLDNGDIIFNTSGAMVRQSPCATQPVWVLDEVLHHSNQRDADGNIWTPSVGGGGYADNAFLAERVRDDAIARVSPDGVLLERRSFARIMRDNGLAALLLGTQGMQLNTDPIHINEIAVAPSDTRYWRRGDLLISARHLSTLFLYRPSTGRIIWHRTGPWMNQHAAAFVDDHRISVFNNNVIAATPGDQPFLEPADTNQFMVFDFNSGTVTRPFKALMVAAQPRSVTEGRARMLPDGGLFLEETNRGRLLRFARDRLLWSYVNDIGDDKIGAVSWSRYLAADAAAPALAAIAALKCPAGD